MSEYEKAVKWLWAARVAVYGKARDVERTQQEIAASPVGLVLERQGRQLAEAREQESQARAVLEGLVKARYDFTGEKGQARKEAAWVVVKAKIVIPDEARAVDWAHRNAPVVLETKLKRKLFDGLVKDGLVPEAIAKVDEEPAVNVASDLSPYVEVDDDTEY